MKLQKNTVILTTTRKAVVNAIQAKGINVTNLLGVSSDYKTIKGEQYGYLTGILYMMPNLRICPASKMASCFEGCLQSAGRGAFNNVKLARMLKTQLFELYKDLFFSLLIHDIERLVKQATKKGMIPCIRLNGTSDIDYENYPLIVDGVLYANIFALFPEVVFYDYTKRCERLNGIIPTNYDLTLSYSEARSSYANKVLEYAKKYGVNVAVVFAGKLPSTFKGLDVINADDSDLRFLDEKSVICGLSAKGKAKRDHTGFVIRHYNPERLPR